MSEIVYRLQGSDGRGPFRPGFSHLWSDREGGSRLPPWTVEFDLQMIKRKFKPGEHYGCAVRRIEQINAWFSPAEQRRLVAMGFRVVKIDADRILAESENQVVFATYLPLNLAGRAP